MQDGTNGVPDAETVEEVIGTPTPEPVEILEPSIVRNIAFRFARTGQVDALCRSHEELRRMVGDLAERVAKQSELLSKRAEKQPEKVAGRHSKGSGY